MEAMRQIAKEVITKALVDLIHTKRFRVKGEFKHSGNPYVDKSDNILFSKITKDHIDIELLKWFESKNPQRFSFRYWLGYSDMNPNAIIDYVKKLRAIVNGEHLEDEHKLTDLEKRDLKIEIEKEKASVSKLRGFHNKVYPSHPSKKWMNI